MLQASSRHLLRRKTPIIRGLASRSANTAIKQSHSLPTTWKAPLATEAIRRCGLLDRTTRRNRVGVARPFTTSFSDDSELLLQNELIKTYVDKGKVHDAYQLLLLMQKEDDPVFPDSSAYSSILHSWLGELADQDNDGDISHDVSDERDDEEVYAICERATEVLFAWRDAALSSELLRVAPSTKDYNAVLNAWIRVAHVKGVPQRAQHVLERMEQQREESMVLSLVTVDSYNAVLKTWANSKEHLRGTMAQALLDRMCQEIGKPTGTSRRIMMAAWVKSGETKAAFRATGHLMKLVKLLEYNQDQKDLQPTLDEYYSIFEAWTTARDKHAAEKSLSVLNLMENAYLNRFSDLRPDLNIFRWILQAYAKSDASPVLGDDIEIIWHKIWDAHSVPDTACFEAAIQTYMNCALHKDLDHDPWPLAQRAHTLLLDMVKAVQRSDAVKVSTQHYNMVLKAYTGVRLRDASEAAMKLLDTMEQTTDQRPDTTAYALAITIVSNSPTVASKVQVSQELIARAEKEYETGSNDAAHPNVHLYNGLLRACAAATHGSDAQREETFRLALQTMQREIKNPDSDTYYWLLEAASSLLPRGTMQNKAMEHIFTVCAKAGLVDRVLLTRFRALATDDVFLRVVVDYATLDEDGTRVIPLSWTRNVSSQGLVVQRKSARGAALSVQGDVFVTSKMKDARMKTMRSRKTQKLLRGGRSNDNGGLEESSFSVD